MFLLMLSHALCIMRRIFAHMHTSLHSRCSAANLNVQIQYKSNIVRILNFFLIKGLTGSFRI